MKCDDDLVRDKEIQTPMYAFNAGVMHRSLKGLDPRINPDRPPRNFGDAMKAAYNSEYLGFKQREVFKLVKPAPGSGGANPRHIEEVGV